MPVLNSNSDMSSDYITYKDFKMVSQLQHGFVMAGDGMPLELDSVVEKIEDLKSIHNNYIGKIVYVESEKTYYTCIDSEGNWQKA